MRLSTVIVGAGSIAQMRHLPAYRKEQLVRVQAICDIDYRRAQRIAKIYTIPNVYRSFEEMLSRESPDIVDICSSASTHAPLAIQALRNGANVLVEKPMAMDYPSAKQVYEVAKASKKKFAVVQNYRFTAEFKSLKKAVAEGKLGRVDLMYGYFDSPSVNFMDQFLPIYACGILFETGIHDVDLARDLMGEVVRAGATITRRSAEGQAISLISFLEHKSKAVSVLRLSFAAATGAHRLEVSGSKARARLDFDLGSLEFESEFRITSVKENIRFATKEMLKSARNIKRHFGDLLRRGMHGFGGFQPFEELIHKFVVSVHEDTEPPVTLEEAYTNMKILEACRISLETGRSQRIADLA